MKRRIRKIKRKLKRSNSLLMIVFLIILVLIIFSVLFGRNLINNNNDYNKLVKEAKEINNNLKVDNFNTNYIDGINKNMITNTKSNIMLEKAIEGYSLEYSEVLNKCISSLKDNNYINLLSTTNYSNDGNFSNSFDYINKKQDELDDLDRALNRITYDIYYNVYIEDYTKNKRIINRYDRLIKIIINKDEVDSILNDINKAKNIINVSNEVLVYLNDNRASWHIENNEIVFTDQNIKNTYEEMINKIKDS